MMMKTRTLLTLMFSSSFAVSFAVSAGVPNPDNDSATYFASATATAAPTVRTVAAGLPSIGAISEDGLYMWKNPDKGWVARSHSFVLIAGGFEHAPDCLAYNLPKPAGGPSPSIGAGS
jgi:hypothetical protein